MSTGASLARLPVTQEAAGSSRVVPAIYSQKSFEDLTQINEGRFKYAL